MNESYIHLVAGPKVNSDIVMKMTYTCRHRPCAVWSFTMALSYVHAWGDLPFRRDRERFHLMPRIVDRFFEHNIIQIACDAMCHCVVFVDASPSSLREAQQVQFNNKDHSDVTFMVNNQRIYGSIETLSRKSQYFEAMFRSKMKESIEGVVVVPDVSAVVYVKLLEYLCLDDFVLDDLDMSSKEELSVLAEMYMLDGLKLLCN